MGSKIKLTDKMQAVCIFAVIGPIQLLVQTFIDISLSVYYAWVPNVEYEIKISVKPLFDALRDNPKAEKKELLTDIRRKMRIP